MLRKLFFRLMGIQQTPPEPFQGEVSGVRFHVDARPDGNASIWVYLSRDQMQIEPQIRRGSDEHVPRTKLDHLCQAVWNYGGSTIDIGLSGDKIEVMASTAVNKVDRQFAQTLASLMVQIRDEALGERQPYMMSRPWTKVAEAQINLNGEQVIFEFSSCLVHTEDDLAGNLDLMVRTVPFRNEEQIADGLRLALPGFDDLVESDGYGRFDDGDGIIGMSFGLANSAIGFDQDVRDAIHSLEAVEVFWGDERKHQLAKLPCDCEHESEHGGSH